MEYSIRMNLYNKLKEPFQNNGDSWAKVIAHTLSEDELGYEVGEYGGIPSFELWTANYVYSVVSDTEDGDYITSVHRNPPKH